MVTLFSDYVRIGLRPAGVAAGKSIAPGLQAFFLKHQHGQRHQLVWTNQKAFSSLWATLVSGFFVTSQGRSELKLPPAFHTGWSGLLVNLHNVSV